jgi:membrane dipeptidase
LREFAKQKRLAVNKAIFITQEENCMPDHREFNFYPYDLDEEAEKRSQRLHYSSIIIDMLFQGPVGSAVFSEEMTAKAQMDYEKHHDADRAMTVALLQPVYMATRSALPAFRRWWDVSGITAGNRQLDMDTYEGMTRSMAFVTLQFDCFDWLTKATTGSEIRKAKAEGKHAGFVSAQNTLAVGQNLDNLDMLYDFGLRMLQLTYNSMNLVGAGCTERTDAGISSFGVKFIERMNKLGILVDTGHCGRQTTLDAAQISSAPVVASHTCAAALSGHSRGKSDEELIAIANSGGVIGVVMVPTFLNMQRPATMHDFLDHVEYISNLVGWQHVGIGTDWPMSLPEWGLHLLAEELAPQIGFSPQDKIPSIETVDGFSDYRQFINITRGLVTRGYSDEQIQGILGENWLRVIDQVCMQGH